MPALLLFQRFFLLIPFLVNARTPIPPRDSQTQRDPQAGMPWVIRLRRAGVIRGRPARPAVQGHPVCRGRLDRLGYSVRWGLLGQSADPGHRSKC